MKAFLRNAALLAGFAAGVTGCANSPISDDLKQQAQPLTVPEVAANPDSTVGQTVIWGGTVVKTEPQEDGQTLYVQELPLKDNEKPRVNAPSIGEFVAQENEPMRPNSFRPGTIVTIAGTVEAPEQRHPEKYPVVRVAQLHIWASESPTAGRTDWGAGPYRGWQTPDSSLYGPHQGWQEPNSSFYTPTAGGD